MRIIDDKNLPHPLATKEITFAADAPLLLSVEAYHLKV